ncbi:MAG: NAD-dependent epimerase/dehydratase family protein [Brevinema sp.]
MKKRCIIVGGTGYIGMGLSRYLQNRDIISYSRHSIPPVDVRFPSTIPTIDADEVIFSAGLIKNTISRDSDEVAIQGLENVLQALAQPTRFIYLSSLAAVPDKDNKPITLYGKRKLKAEKILDKYRDKHQITVLRPCAVYGEEGSGFNVLIRFMKRYQAYPVLPTQTISLVSLKDLCSAVQLCLDNPQTVNKTYPVIENHYTWQQASLFFARQENITLTRAKKLPQLPFLDGLFQEWIIQSDELRALGWNPSPIK